LQREDFLSDFENLVVLTFENVPDARMREELRLRFKNLDLTSPTSEEDYYILWTLNKVIFLSSNPQPSVALIEKDYDAIGLHRLGGSLVQMLRGKPHEISGSEAMRAVLNENYHFGRIGKKGDLEFVGCPKDIASECFYRATSLGRASEITRIITAPTLREDLSILSKKGLDPQTGIYLISEQAVAEEAVAEEAEEFGADGWKEVEHLLSGFPFNEPLDKANAVAALLLSCCRTALDEAPLILITSAVRADGKSTLGRILGLICTGVRGRGEIGDYASQEETDKKITQLLLEGVPFIQLDDFEGSIGGRVLTQLLTAKGRVSLRALGKSAGKEVDPRVLFVATGKNLVATEDCISRSRTIRLNSKTDRPELRSFAFDPLEYVAENRSRIIAGLLRIITDFHSSNASNPPAAHSEMTNNVALGLCRFKKMRALIDRIVMHRYGIDPSLATEIAEQEDDELAYTQELFQALRECFKDNMFSSKDILDIYNEKLCCNSYGNKEVEDSVRAAISFLTKEKVTIRSVGLLLRKLKSRRVLDFVLSSQRSRTKVGVLWRVGVYSADQV
jgi:putative DNA primase/helicase